MNELNLISKKFENMYIGHSDDTHIYYDNNNINRCYITFIKNNVEFTGKYNLLGCYDTKLSMWIWGKNIKFIEQSFIKNFNDNANLLKKKMESDLITKEVEEFLYYIYNDTFYLSSDNIKNVMILGLYLTNGKYIVEYKNNPILTEYIIVDKVTKNIKS